MFKLSQVQEMNHEGDEILWCPQHVMTPEQDKELNEKYCISEIITLEKARPKLYKKLSSIMNEHIGEEVNELYSLLVEEQPQAVVMPIGTPHFNACLFIKHGSYLGKDLDDNKLFNGDFLFALSHRKVTEKKVYGQIVKTSIFNHRRFISTNI